MIFQKFFEKQKMNQQEFKIFITQRWDHFKTKSLENKMNAWMDQVRKERTTKELDAFVVIDKVNTHQVGDGNTMVVVVYRVEFDEKMPSDGKSGEESTGTEKSKLMNESG